MSRSTDDDIQEEEQTGAEKPRASFLRRAIKFLVWAGVLLGVLLVASGVALQYFLPPATLKPIIERKAAEALKMPFSLGDLSISLLSGIEVRQVVLGDGDKPIARIESLRLDYDLTQLLQGRLVINRIEIDRPALHLTAQNGIWNFQPLLAKKEEGKPAPKPSRPKPTAPEEPLHIPVAIDLAHLAINRFQADVTMDDKLSARIEGLSLKAKGKVDSTAIQAEVTLLMEAPESDSKHNIEFIASSGENLVVRTLLQTKLQARLPNLNGGQLSGTVQLRNSEAFLGRPIPVAPDISLDLDVAASLNPQTVDIRTLNVAVGKGNRLQLQAQAKHFKTDPEFTLSLRQGEFDLNEIMRWVGAFVTPTTVGGKIKFHGLEIAGKLPGFRPETLDVTGGELVFENFSATHPPLPAQIQNLNAVLALKQVQWLRGSLPPHLDLDLQVSTERIAFRDIALRRFKHHLTLGTASEGSTTARLTFATTTDGLAFRHPTLGALETGFTIAGVVEGDPLTGNISLPKFNAKIGNILTVALRASAEDFGKKTFTAEPAVDIDLGQLLPMLPAKMRDNLGLSRLRGTLHTALRLHGQLDETQHPTAVEGDVDFRLTDVELAHSAISAQGLNIELQTPVQVDMQKGVRLTAPHLAAKIRRLDALDTWRVDGLDVDSRLLMDQFYPLQGQPTTLPLGNNLKLKATAISGKNPQLHLTGLAVDAQLRGDALLAAADFRNLTLRARIALNSIDALQQIKTGKVASEISLDANDRKLTRIRLEMKHSVDSPKISAGGINTELNSVRLNALAHGDLKNGNLDLDRLLLESPKFVRLEAHGGVTKKGETFKAVVTVPELHLAPLWTLLPADLREKFADLKVGGTANLDIAVNGRKPDEKALKTLNLPVDARIAFGLKQASVELQHPAVRVQGLNLGTEFRFGNNRASLAGKLTTEKLFLADALGQDWLNPEFEFRYQMDDWNKISVQKHRLTVANRGFNHTVSGKIEGLKPFALKKVDAVPAEFLRRLEAVLNTETSLKIDQALPMLKDVRLHGGLSSKIGINLAAGREATLDGEVRFADFNAAVQPSLKIEGLDGAFLFSKKLLVSKELPSEMPSEFDVAEKGFFSQLRDFSRYKNILRIAVVEYDGRRIGNVGMDILFKDNRLAVEKFAMDALKGSISGQFFLVQTQRGPRLAFTTEFAGLDFNELVKEKRTGGKASQVDGNLRLGFQIRQGEKNERIALDQLGMKFAITRIGEETLDRILLFLDPDENKPAIVDTRAKLKLATPHRLLIALENGNISVETWLKSDLLGGIVKAPDLQRVPLAGLRQFTNITEQLQALAALRDALNFAAARGVLLKQDNTLQLY